METQLCLSCILQALALLVVANGTPVIARNIAGTYFNWPVDFGLMLTDAQPFFGDSKTWRGLIVAVISGAIVAGWIGLTAKQGALFALLVMIGDLFASFTKRRLRLAPSSRSRVLDVIPESLLPAVIMKTELELNMIDIGLVVLIFFLIEVYLSPILYRWHIRKRPY